MSSSKFIEDSLPLSIILYSCNILNVEFHSILYNLHSIFDGFFSRSTPQPKKLVRWSCTVAVMSPSPQCKRSHNATTTLQQHYNNDTTTSILKENIKNLRNKYNKVNRKLKMVIQIIRNRISTKTYKWTFRLKVKLNNKGAIQCKKNFCLNDWRNICQMEAE